MADAIDSILASFSPAQQDAIKALIAQEAAKNAPPAPRELTEAEQAALHVEHARKALQNDLNVANFQGRVLAILDMLVAKVYAEAAPATADTTSTSSETSTSTEGSAI